GVFLLASREGQAPWASELIPGVCAVAVIVPTVALFTVSVQVLALVQVADWPLLAVMVMLPGITVTPAGANGVTVAVKVCGVPTSIGRACCRGRVAAADGGVAVLGGSATA